MDGQIVLNDDDAQKTFAKFVNFYGCTVEDVVPEGADGEDDDNADPSLTSDQTKGN